MSNYHYRERLASLFADFECLAADPASASPKFLQKLEELRKRLSELEMQITESENCAESEQQDIAATVIKATESEEVASSSRSVPILYETERIGYAYSGDQVRPVQQADVSEATRVNAISSPLVAGGQTIGEVKIDPARDRTWTAEETNIIQTVAQQVSIQIQNLQLLAATERARSEAEAATRRFMHESWDSYLDAIHQSERVGYAYDQSAITPHSKPVDAEDAFHEDVKVMDELVGDLYLQSDPTRPLTEEDKAMVAAIANRIAQQVENIRLLADASRARAEAEAATRRMTRENWDAYVAQKAENPGFVYDSNRVIPLTEDALPQALDVSQPLTVRGEVIGQLAIAGLPNIAPDAKELAAAIAAQTSIHLETLRLTEELQKRAEELLELDRLKSTFLANMSHELRTPLNSILGFTDVILEELDGPLTENMGNDLRLIQKNGQHLLHLINDVLDMAKINAGRMNLSFEKFRVQEVFEEVISVTSPLASEKALAFLIEPDSDPEVEISADRTRIRQVMLNLVNNAIKFTEKGKVSLHVKCREHCALIKIKDSGIGIPPDKLEIIFQEFAQVDSSATRKVGGTGLGLPISRRLIELHNGKLWAESSGVSGEGSTFIVELPLEAQATKSVEK